MLHDYFYQFEHKTVEISNIMSHQKALPIKSMVKYCDAIILTRVDNTNLCLFLSAFETFFPL